MPNMLLSILIGALAGGLLSYLLGRPLLARGHVVLAVLAVVLAKLLVLGVCLAAPALVEWGFGWLARG